MLWRKAWYETRTQFLLGVAVTASLCAVIILFQEGPRRHADPAMSYTTYVWSAIYKDYLRNLFVLLAIVLGGGTLLQERSRGTSGFTLVLPVSRARLVSVRAAVGMAEVVCLALVPVAVLPLASILVGQQYAASDAFEFAILWSAGGVVLFSTALFVSSIIANEYVAWSVTFLLVIAYEGIVNFTAPSRYQAIDLFRLMNGSGAASFDAASHVVGALPRTAIVATLVAAVAALLATIWVTSRKEY